MEGYRKELNLHLSELEDLIERQSFSRPRREAPIDRPLEDRVLALLAEGHEELLGAFRELEEQIELLLGVPAIPAIPHRPPGLDWVDVAAAAELTPQEIDQALLWLTYDDVLRRFGPPDSIVGLSDCKISWRYDLGPRGEIALEFMDGHVVKVWR